MGGAGYDFKDLTLDNRNVYCYRCGKIEVSADGDCISNCTFHHGDRFRAGLDKIIEGLATWFLGF